MNNQSQGIMAGSCWTPFFTQLPSFCWNTLFWTISSAWDTAPSGTPFFMFLFHNNFHYRQPQYWSWSVIFCGGLCLWNNIHGLWKVGLKRNLHFAGIQRRPTFGWTQHYCLHSSSGCNIFLLYWNFKEDSKDSLPMSLAHSFIHTESQFTNNTMFILLFQLRF